MKLQFVVPGRPVPTARVRVQNGRAQTPRSTVEYQSKVAKATRTALAAVQGWNPEGPFKLDVFIFTTRRDCDGSNILKGIEDALVRAGAMRDDNLAVLRGVRWRASAAHFDEVHITLEVECS
jgi:Holliday junction resolvase RusA-like endonuclease